MKKIVQYLLVVILVAFGLLSLFLTTSIIFDLFGIRAQEGHYVLTVVWANFLCGILYLFSAYGFIKSKKWTVVTLGIAALILINAFILFGVHIYTNGVYESKTIGAMIIRLSITIVFGTIAYFIINKEKKSIK